MIVVDTTLEQRERERKPIRVAMTGAGYMGRGIDFQMVNAAQGMQLVAISNCTLSRMSTGPNRL